MHGSACKAMIADFLVIRSSHDFARSPNRTRMLTACRLLALARAMSRGAPRDRQRRHVTRRGRVMSP
jgi:hypothetical protein